MGSESSKPWRETDIKDWDNNMYKNLRTDVMKDKRKELNILMFGSTGQGKSAFVNTVFSALHGMQKSVTTEALDSTESITLGVQEYQLNDGDKQCNVSIYDMPGVEHSMKSNDAVKLLDGILSSREQKETEGNHFYIGKPIHAMIICNSFVQTFEVFSCGALYKNCVIKAAQRRVPVFLLVTKIDTAELKSTAFETSRVFYTLEFEKNVKDASKYFGIPPKNVVLQQNYHGVNHQINKTDIDILTLYNLRFIINNIDY